MKTVGGRNDKNKNFRIFFTSTLSQLQRSPCQPLSSPLLRRGRCLLPSRYVIVYMAWPARCISRESPFADVLPKGPRLLAATLNEVARNLLGALMTVSGVQVGRPWLKKTWLVQLLAAPNHSKAKKAFVRRVQRPLQIHANWSRSWWDNLVRPSTQSYCKRLLWDVCAIVQGDIRIPIIIGLK